MGDDGLGGIGELLAVVHSFVGSLGSGVRACLLHEYAHENTSSILGAVGSNIVVHVTIVFVVLSIEFELGTLGGLAKVEAILLLVVEAGVSQVGVLVACGETLVLVVRIFAVAHAADAFAVVLGGGLLCLEKRFDEIVHVDDVIGSVAAHGTAVRGTELEMNETLFVHSIVGVALLGRLVVVAVVSTLLLAIVILLLAIVVVPIVHLVGIVVLSIVTLSGVFAVFCKVSAVIILRRNAGVELDGISGDPGNFPIASIELTGLGEDAVSEFRIGADVGRSEVDFFGGLDG